MTVTPAATLLPFTRTSRIESIDLLRGVVMIIMALDHVRDYFHADAFLFNPTDLTRTTPMLFFTRFITHFCAPVFVFLAGTSAFMIGSRKGKWELSSFLVKRALWLIVLEFTVLNFAWFFNIHFPLLALTVIWALAIGMASLALFVHLPYVSLVVLGGLLVFGHNALDNIHYPGSDGTSILWSFLHDQGFFHIGPFDVFIGYPSLPWIGVMLLGYAFGALYDKGYDTVRRKQILVRLGVAGLILFAILRGVNIYGDPHPWETQPTALYTALSFFNVTKYPPSLDYLLITLSPSMLFLAFTERATGKAHRAVVALGRVPMFYYIVHIYMIHILALIAALLTGFTAGDMTFTTWVTDSPRLRGYGFGLGFTYLVWIGVVMSLLPLCIAYDRYKQNNREKWWLSYL